MKTKRKVQASCTSCGSIIELELDALLISNFEQSIKSDLASEMKRREEQIVTQKEEVLLLSQKLEAEKSQLNELVKQRVNSQLTTRQDELKKSIREELEQEKELQISELHDELQKKSKQLIEFNQTKSKMERLQREFEEKEAEIHLKMEAKLSEQLKSMKSSIKDEVEMSNALILKQKDLLIDGLKKSLDIAKQKVSQGSMQIQGESQELLLEEILRAACPNDLISEVAKGARGADAVQEVRTSSGKIAGKILYESKSTKQWSDSWVSKLRKDNLEAKADILVIVTTTMPSEAKNQKFFLMDNVFITKLEFVHDLSLLLRYGILKAYGITLTMENASDKKSVLYSYLTSEDFKNTFENILTSFKNLQDSHHDEQRKMQLLWKKREAFLSEALRSSIDFYGNIKGITNNVPEIQLLQFPKAS